MPKQWNFEEGDRKRVQDARTLQFDFSATYDAAPFTRCVIPLLLSVEYKNLWSFEMHDNDRSLGCVTKKINLKQGQCFFFLIPEMNSN